MKRACNENGTVCRRKNSESESSTPNSNSQIILGSIACFVFFVIVGILMHSLCLKRYIRLSRPFRFQRRVSQANREENQQNPNRPDRF